MSDDTPILGLPFIIQSQAQKHVTHNEALLLLDTLVQTVVLSRITTDPPGTPAAGALYIVPAAATGAWSGRTDQLAYYQFNAWRFFVPKPGWTARVLDEDIGVVFGGSGWGPAVPNRLSVERIGVSAAADDVNRLAVSSSAVLLTHAGSGHQLKINKATTADTASLLFQNNFSGRAEMGLAGSDGFAVKVSADGTSFSTAFEASPATGRVTFPAGVVIDAPIGGTAVTQDAMDTTAGRLIKVGDYGLGGILPPLTGPNALDLMTTSQRVRVDAAAVAVVNAPAGALEGICETLAAATTSVIQEYREVAGALRIWRRGLSGLVWSPWRQLYTQANIVGPVGQVSGVPTGAVIETGANANGDFIRHADGTQICHHRVDLSSTNFSTAIGTTGFFAAAMQSWTYPASFVTGPRVVGTIERPVDTVIGIVSLRSSPSTTSATFIPALSQSVTTTATRRIHFLAIGRWF